jgi:hypothetical protein
MNYNIKQMFVVKAGRSLLATGTTASLAEGQLGIFKPDYTPITSAPTGLQAPYLILAEGTGNTEVGSFKTSKIYLKKVTAWRGNAADSTGKEQITYIGWDEINATNSPGIQCDKSYTVIVRVFEHYLRSVWCPYLQEGVVVKSACCADCTGNCDDLDCSVVFDEFATKINTNPRLKNYVTASVVKTLVSGSAPTTKFGLVLQDPGTNVGAVTDVNLNATAAAGFTPGTYTGITMTSTSGLGTGATYNFTVSAGGLLTAVSVNAAGSGYVIGEVITFLGTKILGGATPADDFTITVTSTSGAEGVLLSNIRTLYASKVANVETDIVYSAAAGSSDGDVNATGNVMIELTPLSTVTLASMDPYLNAEWIDITAASTAVYACGLKLVGTTPNGFNAPDCIPDAVPYIANKVRFKVYAGEAPSSSQLEDLPDFCNLWSIENTQEVKYPVGVGTAIAEIERNYAGYNQPAVSSHRYWIPYYNGDFITFADSALEYDVYELEYDDPSLGGFENKTVDALSIMVAIPKDAATISAGTKAAFEATLNGWLALSPAYSGPVAL